MDTISVQFRLEPSHEASTVWIWNRGKVDLSGTRFRENL